jgi:hypothetical protein
MHMGRTLVGAMAVFLVGGGGLSIEVAHAKSARAAAKEAAATPAADTPDAIAALKKMGAFLRDQHMFVVKGQMTTDDVLASGQKVQMGSVVVLKVRRPDRLRVDIDGDRRVERLFYDGKTFTAFGKRDGYFAQFDAPPTLAELTPVLEKKYGVDLPLGDLFYWGTPQDGSAAIKSATLVGTSVVGGASCDHYAIHQADVDWEIWIEQGARPVPRKVVITTTSERMQPQHVMVLDWDLNPKLGEDAFTFVPPADAHRIEFEKATQAGGAK